MHGQPYRHIHTGWCDMAPADGIWGALSRGRLEVRTYCLHVRIFAWPAPHIMHARICKRHANQAGRGKRTQIPSGGAKSRRLMCMCPSLFLPMDWPHPAGGLPLASMAGPPYHACAHMQAACKSSRPGQPHRNSIGRGQITSPHVHVPLFLPMDWPHPAGGLPL